MANTELTICSTPKDITAFLDRGKASLQRALPKHLNADRLIRLAVTAFSTTPKLRECTAQSILGSLMVAAQIGLEPGIAGQGYLIPYWDGKNRVSICTFVPGWQGLVGLLNNSGRATAWTGAVFDGDEWDFQLGSRPRCRHKPGPNYGDPKFLKWVYACGKVNGAEQTVVEAWPIARVWAHRDKFNKVGDRHYSFAHPEMYARKVVLLQVLKYMPRSIELQNAITASDAAEIGNTSTVEEGIVIDVETVQDIPQGRIGNSNPLDDAAKKKTEPKAPAAKPADVPEEAPAKAPTAAPAAQEKPKVQEPAPEPEAPAGPSADELRSQLLWKAKADANMGKAIVIDFFGGPEAWAALDAGTLADALAAWPETLEAIKAK